VKLNKRQFLRHRDPKKIKPKPNVVLKKRKFAEGMCQRCGWNPPSEPGKKHCFPCLEKMSVGGAVIWAVAHGMTRESDYKKWLGKK